MKTYPAIDENGVLVSFEISMAQAGPKILSRFVEGKLGGKVYDRRKSFSDNEVHFRFSFLNHDLLVWEPFGDNSRYWIGFSEDSPKDYEIMSQVHGEFQNFKPGLKGWITGFFQI